MHATSIYAVFPMFMCIASVARILSRVLSFSRDPLPASVGAFHGEWMVVCVPAVLKYMGYVETGPAVMLTLGMVGIALLLALIPEAHKHGEGADLVKMAALFAGVCMFAGLATLLTAYGPQTDVVTWWTCYGQTGMRLDGCKNGLEIKRVLQARAQGIMYVTKDGLEAMSMQDLNEMPIPESIAGAGTWSWNAREALPHSSHQWIVYMWLMLTIVGLRSEFIIRTIRCWKMTTVQRRDGREDPMPLAASLYAFGFEFPELAFIAFPFGCIGMGEPVLQVLVGCAVGIAIGAGMLWWLAEGAKLSAMCSEVSTGTGCMANTETVTMSGAARGSVDLTMYAYHCIGCLCYVLLLYNQSGVIVAMGIVSFWAVFMIPSHSYRLCVQIGVMSLVSGNVWGIMGAVCYAFLLYHGKLGHVTLWRHVASARPVNTTVAV